MLLQGLYEETKNPFFVYTAILQSDLAEVPTPDWVNNYLKASALELLNMSPNGGTNKVKDNQDVLSALGFSQSALGKVKGTPCANADYKKWLKKFDIAESVDIKMFMSGISQNQAVQQIAEENVMSPSTVLRYYQDIQKILDK
jgi:hypothetical protein